MAPRSSFRSPAILIFLIVIFNASLVAAAPVGTVTKVQKQAQIGSTTAVVGTPVNMNDEIRTGPDARLQITFRDETLLTLGENARVVVDRYIYDPSTSTGVFSLDATQGALRFATGKLGKMTNKDVTVTTPSAALAVRGTVFWAGFIDLQYGVLLLSKNSKVDVSNSVGSVTLSEAGEGTDIPPPLKDDFAPLEPYPWPADKVARALAMTNFGLALGPEILVPGLFVIPAAIDDDRNRPVSP